MDRSLFAIEIPKGTTECTFENIRLLPLGVVPICVTSLVREHIYSERTHSIVREHILENICQVTHPICVTSLCV